MNKNICVNLFIYTDLYRLTGSAPSISIKRQRVTAGVTVAMVTQLLLERERVREAYLLPLCISL